MVEKRATDQNRAPIDKTRASRAGHAYHEAWAARSALELLPPQSSLKAIAVEGFSIEDSPGMSDQAVEIADLVRYHGDVKFARASSVEIVQFKYSIANQDTAIRAADLAKTLNKFAQAESDLRTSHGPDRVKQTARYVFATNRPIHVGLLTAIEAISLKLERAGDVSKQADQILEVLKPYAFDPSEFLSRLSMAGGQGSLRDVEGSIRSTLANWGAPEDVQSEERLFRLCGLIRNKVGIDGAGGNNLLDRVSILAELRIENEAILYPTPASFPNVTHVIARPLVDDIVRECGKGRPVLVHGTGGMGKTVLLQAVAHTLAAYLHVVTFDGFGGGDWRDPADGRYRADRTLLHLGNLLAAKGLCDIVLPITDEQALLRVFRQRLAQSVAAARQARPDGGVALILDAIDHAGISARENSANSFAHLLIKSLVINPIEGVRIIASCRTERRAEAVADLSCLEIQVPAFSKEEVASLVGQRDPSASSSETAALFGRSGGNPRCLDALIVAGRPYDGPLPIESKMEPGAILDALLLKRIEAARESAVSRGASFASIGLLLSGLAILPPPVPFAELSAAYGLSSDDVESFAADLFPLLERTPFGLRFRDEPTETLVRKLSENDHSSRLAVIQALVKRQDQSDYAARALPSVLTAEHNVDQLLELAFDPRVPPTTSKVGQRDIRLSRILAALAATAKIKRFGDLFRLLLEASLVSAGHATSDKFLYSHPDLVAIGGDIRRLMRTHWCNLLLTTPMCSLRQ